MRGRCLMAAAVMTLTLAGCGDDRVCDPGATQKCWCASGAAGSQTCDTSGGGWGACACAGKPDKGADQGQDLLGPDAGPDDGGLDAVTCQKGLTSCFGVCVNLKTDIHNCGACSSKCKAPATTPGAAGRPGPRGRRQLQDRLERRRAPGALGPG